ncbi:MAG: glycerol-3-phosphate acyltransferase [Oscillospiraceae bacterium]|jgi:glycerol-3-phosphate acyltransferase PlsY|nr:glycerol-3-phosphate acyltransferase [Oscillospiraceae bacterium]
MLVFAMAVTAIVAYSLGGVNGAIIASKYIFGNDIRENGSGNAGLTNAYRVFGIKGAVVTLAIDTAKAAIAIGLGWLWVGGEAAALIGSPGGQMVGKLFAGFFAMVGHAFPVWYGYKGGKGVLVCGVMALMINPWVGLCSWGVFILMVLATRYVSLGSIVAGAIAFPLFTAIFIQQPIATGLAIASGILIIVMHAANINRLIHGKETKFGAREK